MSIKLYLSGSTQDDNVGVLNYGTEEYRMQFLCDLIRDYIKKFGGDITVYRNNGFMNLAQTIKDSNDKKADYHLSIHSNAGGNDGTETYYYFKDEQLGNRGKKLATYIHNAVAPLTIASDQGVRPDNILYDIGLAELRETIAPAALIEIMYHDNKSDVIDYLSKIDKIAEAIARAFYSFLNMPVMEQKTTLYRVMCGSYKNVENAQVQVQKLKNVGFDAVIMNYSI